nr:hypothetical protein [Tanacetum cinerariifolium]
MLKALPWKRVINFGKREKLNHGYIRPFMVLAKVGPVAYKLELPQQISKVHSTFHVLNLKKCLLDESLIILLEKIQVNDKPHFVEEPVQIMDQKVKQLKESRIPIIKFGSSASHIILSDTATMSAEAETMIVSPLARVLDPALVVDSESEPFKGPSSLADNAFSNSNVEPLGSPATSDYFCFYHELAIGSSVRAGYKLSNESLLERLSCNIFITNFHVHLSAKELWNTCVQYGLVQDVYIPKKLSKYSKPFAFARFNKGIKTSIFSQTLAPKEPMHVNLKPKELMDGFGFAKVVRGNEIQECHDTPMIVLERGPLNNRGGPVLVGCVNDFKTLTNIHNVCFGEGFNRDGSNSNSVGIHKSEEGNNDHVILDSFQGILNDEYNIVYNFLDHIENSIGQMENSLDHVENSHEKLDNYTNYVENSHVHIENSTKQIENSPNHRNSFLNQKKCTNVEQTTSGSDLLFLPWFNPLNSNQSGNEAMENVAYEGISSLGAIKSIPKNMSLSGSKHDCVDSLAPSPKPNNGFSIRKCFHEFISIGQAMGFGMKCFWGNMLFDFASSSARGAYSLTWSDNIQFLEQDFSSVVKYSWNKVVVHASNSMILLKNKLNSLKQTLKMWSIQKKSIREHDCRVLQDYLLEIDSCLNKRKGCPDDLPSRAKNFHDIGVIDHKIYVDMALKAKIK